MTLELGEMWNPNKIQHVMQLQIVEDIEISSSHSSPFDQQRNHQNEFNFEEGGRCNTVVNGCKYKFDFRILVVDDEPYNILAFDIILKVALEEKLKQEVVNIIVDKAYNGQEALKRVKDSHRINKMSYGLIFMDCSMPIMNGYDSTIAIR